MKKVFLKLLCCPECKSNLEICESEVVADEIKTGTLKCLHCRKEYPIIDFIPVFIEIAEEV